MPNRTLLWSLVAIIVVVLVAVILFLVLRTPTPFQVSTEDTPTESSSTSQSSSEETPSDMGSLAAQISIENFQFISQTVEIKAGETVAWTNNDSVTHDVTSQDSKTDDPDFPLFISGNLKPGQTFAFTFQDPGEYAYFCGIHPYMTGTVIVTAS